MKHLATHFHQNQSGAVALIAGVALPVALAMGAVAVNYTSATTTRTAQQKILDSAVLAAVMLPAATTDSARIKAAQDSYTTEINKLTGSGLEAGSAKATFTIQSVGTDNFQMTGNATADVNLPFGGLVGGGTLKIANASAATKGNSPPVCVYAMNNKANAAVDLNGTVNVSASCPVQANSDDSSAVRAVGNARMNTTVFNVAGDTKGKDAFAPKPATGSPRIADPFANAPFPSAGACAPLSDTTLKTDTTIDPGTYCGGLKVSSGAVVRLNPGVYLFKDGDFKISGGGQVFGEDVLLAFTGKGAKFWMTGGAVMTVTSPKSGPYMNMQFMENRTSTEGDTWVSIGGDSKLTYDGVMYFPLANVWIFGGSIVNGTSPNVVMLGDKLWFQDNSTITLTQENRRGLAVAETPRIKSGAVLVR